MLSSHLCHAANDLHCLRYLQSSFPMKKSMKRISASATVASVAAAALFMAGCHSSGLPKPASAAYQKLVSTFYVGLSALQVGDDVRAQSSLQQVTEIAPGEPAGWADWGILALRQRNFAPATERLNRAKELAPKNERMYYLLGLLGTAQGESQQAIANYQKAVELDPKDLRAAYALALEVERQGAEGSDAEFEKLMKQILAARPRNLAALLELSRTAAKQGDAATLRDAVKRIKAQSSGWPADIQQRLSDLETAASGPEPRVAATRSIFLRNVLMQLPSFRADLAEIKPQPGDEAQPFTQFVKLPSPSSTPDAADMGISFTPESVRGLDGGRWTWIGSMSLNGHGAPTVVAANPREVKLATGATFPFPGGPHNPLPMPEGILPLDFNYDFKTDLVLAGEGGVRFMRQDSPAAFTDVTAATKLPKAVLDAGYTGAWAVDIEADGDLDVVMGQSSGVPAVLRNNGDGTFAVVHPFAEISGIRQFAWADLNGDGNPDAALIDGAGRLHVFFNERSGQFEEQMLPAGFENVKAIAIADVNNGGVLDVVAVLADGAVTRLSNEGAAWTSAQIATVPDTAVNLAGEVRLRATDMDNNGAIDLMLAQVSPSATRAHGALIWLADERGQFHLLNSAAGASQVFDVADVHDDGQMALLGLSPEGRTEEDVNHGTKDYHWQIVRPRARVATGDQRINSFGIGGEIEIRSGLLTQELPITGPQLHFGLGTHTEADVARIIWPNGSVRAEFAMKADQEVLTEQRLKGSCPFLFAWNGKEMNFVKDTVPWGSAIGLRINSIGTAAIAATQEWYKIPGSELVPRNGYYDLRITGELWETYYYDYLSLMVVDHPAGTAVFTDERYVVPPVKLAITETAQPHAIARAVDDSGNDVTDVLAKLDGKYLDNFGRGQYQGVTRDHYVDIDLGPDVPMTDPLYLIAKGWLHPSDSTINVAISQGNHEQPKPLSLSVEDADGKWRVVKLNLGFPEGRNKICLIDLRGVFRPGAPHTVRLSTNLEIYWDQIQWAQGMPKTQMRVTRLAPEYADLHYRGYSTIHEANASSPEIPDYNHLMATTQIWRDLTGYYTRYGDVRPLLNSIDDRYVIMNAGDELALRFPAIAAPPPGWVRDYVIAGDGWVKDGDYNSEDSATVRPLPYHARKLYEGAPKPLEDEWEYKHHAQDWETYQTRYVTPYKFDNPLRSSANQ